MDKKAKNSITMAVIFSAFAIIFAILYVVGAVKNLDSYLALTYMTYFLGLALMYVGNYQKLKQHFKSTKICLVASIALIIFAVVSLIYGLCIGEISLFN